MDFEDSKILPKDVIHNLEMNYADIQDRNLVINFLKEKGSMTLNVGKDQFIRSLLILLNKEVSNIKKYELISDPRDIILLANKMTDNKYNYFIEPLD